MSDDEQKSGSAALRKARSRRKNRRKPEKEESNDSDSGNDSDSNLLGRSRGDELRLMYYTKLGRRHKNPSSSFAITGVRNSMKL